MSIGGILGAAVGGVVGFFIGGPTGALYGASIGFGVGSFLDPISPDVPAPGSPAPDEAVMKSTVGDPCGDVCGTAKITGHLLAYGNEKSVPIYQETSTSGGKGGPPEPQPQITGYDYYMSWQLGICEGPIDTLHAIYRGDDLLWEGPLNKPTSTGKETISISGFGSIDFYFGTDDQVANSGVASIIGDSTLNSPLRHFCWAFMNNCKIGNYPRTPTLHFVVSKIPDVPYILSTSIQTYDMVPMAVTYYILKTMCGLPASWLNDTDFGIVDNTLRFEYRGISVFFKDSVPALTYLNGILSHVDAILRYGSDGQFHPKLIRDDYTVASIPTIDEDDLLDDISLTRPSWIGTVNEIKVQYTEIYNVTRSKDPTYTIWSSGINNALKLSTNHLNGNRIYEFTSDIGDYGDYQYTEIDLNDGVLAQRADGSVWVWGNNFTGQVGTGGQVVLVTPTEITAWKNKGIQNLDMGINISAVLFNDGSLFFSGDEPFPTGASIGTVYEWTETGSDKFFTHMDLVSGSGLAVGLNGELYVIGSGGYNGFFPTKPTDWTLYDYNNGGSPDGPAQQLCTKVYRDNSLHSSIVLCGTTAWVLGDGDHSGVGYDTGNRPFVALSGSWSQFAISQPATFGIKTNGELWAWGINNNNILGIGDPDVNAKYPTPVLVNQGPFSYIELTNSFIFAIDEDGVAWGAGYTDDAEGYGVNSPSAGLIWQSDTLVQLPLLGDIATEKIYKMVQGEDGAFIFT